MGPRVFKAATKQIPNTPNILIINAIILIYTIHANIVAMQIINIKPIPNIILLHIFFLPLYYWLYYNIIEISKK